jgi:hypothetical protein
MDAQALVGQLMAAKEWFDRSSRCLTEADSPTAPSEGLFTAAQQVAHVAQIVDWFTEGAFRPEGFDMDFETMTGEVLKVESLEKAREWLDRSFRNAAGVIGSKSMEEPPPPSPRSGLRAAVRRLDPPETSVHRRARDQIGGKRNVEGRQASESTASGAPRRVDPRTASDSGRRTRPGAQLSAEFGRSPRSDRADPPISEMRRRSRAQDPLICVSEPCPTSETPVAETICSTTHARATGGRDDL